MGAGLALYRVKAELGATLWVVVAGKLILHPLMAFLLVSLISRGDPLAPLVAMLIAATPVASSAYISAELLRFRQGETARFIAVSTPLSALTLCLAGAIALALASMTALR
jgi:predicted permease